jgi:hypothetical protein
MRSLRGVEGRGRNDSVDRGDGVQSLEVEGWHGYVHVEGQHSRP